MQHLARRGADDDVITRRQELELGQREPVLCREWRVPPEEITIGRRILAFPRLPQDRPPVLGDPFSQIVERNLQVVAARLVLALEFGDVAAAEHDLELGERSRFGRATVRLHPGSQDRKRAHRMRPDGRADGSTGCP